MINQKFLIATILKPRGLKGVVKAKLYSDSFSTVKNLGTAFLGDEEIEVESAQFEGDFAYFKFYNIDDVEKAESLRGKDVFVDRNDIEISDDRNFIADLIGMEIFIGDKLLGILQDVLQYGSADVYQMKTVNGSKAFFPALKKLILEINLTENKIVLDKEVYKQVAVYEE